MKKVFFHTDLAQTTILIRLMAGAVFPAEGFRKYLYPPARPDFVLLPGRLFLLIKGGDRWSADQQPTLREGGQRL